MHLIIDGELKAKPTADMVLAFLQYMPAAIGMTAITVPNLQKQEAGYVGIILIAESHISVHTLGKQAWVDIFSCKGFDVPLAVQEATDMLGFIRLKTFVINRGLE